MKTLVKRISDYHEKMFQDSKHMLWLFKVMVVSFIKGDRDGVLEAWCFIRIHWNYRSVKIK